MYNNTLDMYLSKLSLLSFNVWTQNIDQHVKCISSEPKVFFPGYLIHVSVHMIPPLLRAGDHPHCPWSMRALSCLTQDDLSHCHQPG